MAGLSGGRIPAEINTLDRLHLIRHTSLRGHLVALHGFIKKTRTTPDEDLALARVRQKDLKQ
jgi:phage-related protein